MLPEKLKNLRLESNLTQKQVAEHLGISQQSYALWESGKRHPKKIQEIAEFFDVSPDYLLGRTDNKRTHNIDKDLDIALDSFKAFNGKPMTGTDRDTIRNILTEMFKDR
ncbi:helix-turn-helix domain-containing protein [Pseudolactococcus plantarum]|nr:helix-turn-helix transcriptional regulator [Lactococcus plantarum]HCN73953.1 XRE family transcriptional regulator [Lactococcus sp.]